MKQITLLLLFATSLTTWAQERSVARVYAASRATEADLSYFEFNEYDTTLTKAARQYLDAFGKSYQDSLHRKDTFRIELRPGRTDKEEKRSNDLGTKRIMVILHYLEQNYNIEKSKFKARAYKSTTYIDCADLQPGIKKP